MPTRLLLAANCRKLYGANGHEDEQECLRVLPTPTKARAQPDSLPFAYPISGLSIHLSEFPFHFETPAGGSLT